MSREDPTKGRRWYNRERIETEKSGRRDTLDPAKGFRKPYRLRLHLLGGFDWR